MKYLPKLILKMKVTMFNINSIIMASILSATNNVYAADGWELPNKPDKLPDSLESSVLNLTEWFLGFIVMLSVLVIIWGGINYVSSTGNQDQAKSAKQMIKYAFMGLLIAGIAYAAVKLIVEGILV